MHGQQETGDALFLLLVVGTGFEPVIFRMKI